MTDSHSFEGQEVAPDTHQMSMVTRSEIDMQIATAHKFPRSIKRFRDEALQMVTLDEAIAADCFYILPRRQYDRETRQYVSVNIEGPSARFAEVIASAWGNCRAGARIVSDQGSVITAQGVFHDLERNSAIAYEVNRPVVDRDGKRFKADMVSVTGNAASSIALRNAILKGVPKAFWSALYSAARKTAMGDFRTLANRRSEALKEFKAYGVRPEQVYAKLGVAGIEDVTLDHLLILRGLLTAIREGDSTPEQAFAEDQTEGDAAPARPTVPRRTAAEPPPPPPPPPPPLPPAAEPAPPEPLPADDLDEAGAPPAEPPAASPAPEPEQQGPRADADRPAPDTSEPASDGERAHIKMRASARRASLPELMADLKISLDPDTLAGMTKVQFRALKAAL